MPCPKGRMMLPMVGELTLPIDVSTPRRIDTTRTGIC